MIKISARGRLKMTKNDNSKKELKSIPSGSFSRSLSLLGMSISSGAKFIGYKASDVLRDKLSKPERWQNYLMEQAQILASELGKLKGSAMKIGQVLSLYGEQFLPPEINKILKTLQSDSPPVQWSVMEKVIKKQLGEKYFELEIDTEPVAAASLGQVYKAIRKSDGTELALKVQYPGVDKAIDSDLDTIRSVLNVAKLIPNGPAFDEALHEVRTMLHHEANYLKEKETIEFYCSALANNPYFKIPKVYEEYTSKRVLCMSFELGFKIDGEEVQSLSQERRNILGINLMELLCKELFELRVVQTDPHFGNYLVEINDHDERLILLDFGAVRKFPKKFIEPFSRFISSVVHEDDDSIISQALNLGFLKESDSEFAKELFLKLCGDAVIGFSKKYQSSWGEVQIENENAFDWQKTDIVNRFSDKAKDAVFAFKLRPPPREMIFINRKLMGTYFIVRKLGVKFGPRHLLLHYLSGTKI